MRNFEEINRTFTVKTNLISQGLRLGQKVSKGFRKWLKDKMDKCVNCAKSVMQIFAESAESAKSAKPIFATYASANFVGKESNESTVMYRVKSRIPSCLFRYSLDSHHSRSVCSPRTPSLFEAKSQLASPRQSDLPMYADCRQRIYVMKKCYAQ